MSLLNQVLRDLDARHAGAHERQAIPANIKPLPPLGGRLKAVPLALGLLVAAALSAMAVAGQMRGADNPVSVSRAVAASLTATNAAPTAHHPGEPSAVATATPASFTAPEASAVIDAATAESQAVATTELKFDRYLLTPVTAPAMSSDVVPVPASPKRTAKPASVASLTLPAPASAATSSAAASSNAQHKDAEATAEAEATAGDANRVLISPRSAGISEADYRRVAALLDAGQRTEAEAMLRPLLSADPANTLWAMNLARLQVERNDYAAAWETLQRSLPHATRQGEYRAFCGTVLQRLNRTDEAARHYDAALRSNPTEGRWWLGYGIALDAEQRAVEAREAFARAQASGNLSPALLAFVETRLKK